MLLRILKGNLIYNFILFPIIGLIMLSASYFKGGLAHELAFFKNSALLNILFENGMSSNVSYFINYLVLILISFLLLNINARFSFIKERTFLPVYIYLFIVLAITDFHTLQPSIISTVFIIFVINRLYGAFEERDGVSNAFDAGFYIGISTLFYSYAALYILLIPFALFQIQGRVTWRTIVVPLTGAVLPISLLFAAYYIFSDVSLLLNIAGDNILTQSELLLNNIYLQIYFAYMLLITIFASIFIIKQFGTKSISSRKYFIVLFYFFMSSLILIATPVSSIEIIAIMAIPLCFLLTNYLLEMRQKRWAGIFLSILILVSVFMQIFN